jgi:hypothetical protein
MRLPWFAVRIPPDLCHLYWCIAGTKSGLKELRRCTLARGRGIGRGRRAEYAVQDIHMGWGSAGHANGRTGHESHPYGCRLPPCRQVSPTGNRSEVYEAAARIPRRQDPNHSRLAWSRQRKRAQLRRKSTNRRSSRRRFRNVWSCMLLRSATALWTLGQVRPIGKISPCRRRSGDRVPGAILNRGGCGARHCGGSHQRCMRQVLCTGAAERIAQVAPLVTARAARAGIMRTAVMKAASTTTVDTCAGAGAAPTARGACPALKTRIAGARRWRIDCRDLDALMAVLDPASGALHTRAAYTVRTTAWRIRVRPVLARTSVRVACSAFRHQSITGAPLQTTRVVLPESAVAACDHRA